MGFFNLYKPKEYNYRYIYYDPKKETAKDREKKLTENNQNNSTEYKPTIRRGTFRGMAEKSKQMRTEQIRQSNMRLILIIALLIAIAYFLLK